MPKYNVDIFRSINDEKDAATYWFNNNLGVNEADILKEIQGQNSQRFDIDIKLESEPFAKLAAYREVARKNGFAVGRVTNDLKTSTTIRMDTLRPIVQGAPNRRTFLFDLETSRGRLLTQHPDIESLRPIDGYMGQGVRGSSHIEAVLEDWRKGVNSNQNFSFKQYAHKHARYHTDTPIWNIAHSDINSQGIYEKVFDRIGRPSNIPEFREGLLSIGYDRATIAKILAKIRSKNGTSEAKIIKDFLSDIVNAAKQQGGISLESHNIGFDVPTLLYRAAHLSGENPELHNILTEFTRLSESAISFKNAPEGFFKFRYNVGLTVFDQISGTEAASKINLLANRPLNEFVKKSLSVRGWKLENIVKVLTGGAPITQRHEGVPDIIWSSVDYALGEYKPGEDVVKFLQGLPVDLKRRLGSINASKEQQEVIREFLDAVTSNVGNIDNKKIVDEIVPGLFGKDVFAKLKTEVPIAAKAGTSIATNTSVQAAAKGVVKTGTDTGLVNVLAKDSSRIGFGFLKSNKTIGIMGAGAAALVGIGVLQALKSNFSNDDRSNTHEAMKGPYHKLAGIFGSGFKGFGDDKNPLRDKDKKSNTLVGSLNQVKEGFLPVGASSLGQPLSDIKKSLLARSTGDHSDKNAEKYHLFDKAATAAKLGDVLHTLIQKREVGISEVPVYDQESGIYGRIDAIAQNVVKEFKTVSSNHFRKIYEKGLPEPANLLQINAYLGVTGLREGKLVYINREDPKQRITFDVSYNKGLFSATVKKVKRAQSGVAKTAIQSNLPVDSLYDLSGLSSGGNGLAQYSEADLLRAYPVMLFHELTTDRYEGNFFKRQRERDLTRSRKDNKIEALRHGWFGSKREFNTDFGSGFQSENKRKSGDWVSRMAAISLFGGVPAYLYYSNPKLLHSWLRTAEDKSPFGILRTFRLSEKVQRAVLLQDEAQAIGKFQIFNPLKDLSKLKASLQRGAVFAELAPEYLSDVGKYWLHVLGPEDFRKAVENTGGFQGINLERASGNRAWSVKQADAEKPLGTKKIFDVAQADTRAAQEATAWNMFKGEFTANELDKMGVRIGDRLSKLPTWVQDIIGDESTFRGKSIRDVLKFRERQMERGFGHANPQALVPIYSTEKEGIAGALDIAQLKVRRTGYGGMLRLNRLLSEVGLGAETGTFNRVITLPFHDQIAATSVGKSLGMRIGAKGLINQILKKRYWPLMAITGAVGLADYMTGHLASNGIVHGVANLSVGYSAITHAVGLNKYRDWMESVSPFPVQGPAIALPLVGAAYGLFKANRFLNKPDIKGAAATAETQIKDYLARLCTDPSKIGALEDFSKYSQNGVLKYLNKAATQFRLTPEVQTQVTEAISEANILASKSLSNNLLSDSARLIRRASAWKYAKYGLLAAAPFVLASLIPKHSPKELADIYAGKKEVEVRKGRWWELSSTPYEGGKVKEYRKHWVHRFLNRSTRKEEYGSEGEYWKRSLRTPIGWANLLMDPYGEERAQIKRGRYFPLSKEVFVNTPFIGKTVGRFLGHLIKPQKWMVDPEKLSQWYEQQNQKEEPVARLGGKKPKFSKDSGIGNIISDTIAEYQNYVGLPGWLSKLAWNKFTGDASIFKSGNPRLQSANAINDPSRLFYGMELGGGLGQTEVIRRFLATPSQAREYVNPIPNRTIPSWLAEDGDLNQYNYGDPYSKVPFGLGEYLPGKEYNKANHIKGDTENYPLMHKLNVLSHLQPYSRHITSVVQKLKEAELTPDQSYFIDDAQERIKNLKAPEKFQPYVFSDRSLASYKGTVQDVAGEYVRFAEFPYKEFKMGGVDISGKAIADKLMHDNVSRESAIRSGYLKSQKASEFLESKLKPGTPVSFQAEQYAPENLSSAPIAIKGVGDVLHKKFDAPIVNEGPISRTMYNPFSRAVGAVNEFISHSNPIPFVSKFMGANDPIEKYRKDRAFGPSIRTWDRPIRSYVTPAVYQTGYRLKKVFGMGSRIPSESSLAGLKRSDYRHFGLTNDDGGNKHISYNGLMGGLHPGDSGYSTAITREKTPFGSGFMSSERGTPVPGYTEDVRRVQDYFDKLQYVKHKRLQDRAQKRGDDDEAKRQGVLSMKTMTGINPVNSSPALVASTLPKSERPYFSQFVNEPNPAKRREILNLVPKSERRLLLGQWFRQKSHGNIDDSQFKKLVRYANNEGYGANRRLTGADTAMDLARQVSKNMMDSGMPPPPANWSGYDEGVDLKDVQLDYVKSRGMDIHEFDLWENRERMLRRKPYVKKASNQLGGHLFSGSMRDTLYKTLRSAGMSGHRIEVLPSQSGSINVQYELNDDSIVPDSAFAAEMAKSLSMTRDGFNKIDFYQEYANRY